MQDPHPQGAARFELESLRERQGVEVTAPGKDPTGREITVELPARMPLYRERDRRNPLVISRRIGDAPDLQAPDPGQPIEQPTQENPLVFTDEFPGTQQRLPAIGGPRLIA